MPQWRHMCFSPAASFAAAGVLGVAGAATLRSAKTPPARLFAAIPLIFAFQQAVEGVVWLTFGGGPLHAAAVYGFVLISHVFWPVYVPLAVMRLETDPSRRARMQFFVLLGASVALPILYLIMRGPVTATLASGSIDYALSAPDSTYGIVAYVIATCGSCLFSSHKFVRVFGLALLGSFAIAYWSYQQALYSVWCFFAAFLSLIVWAHLRNGAPIAKPSA